MARIQWHIPRYPYTCASDQDDRLFANVSPDEDVYMCSLSPRIIVSDEVPNFTTQEEADPYSVIVTNIVRLVLVHQTTGTYGNLSFRQQLSLS